MWTTKELSAGFNFRTVSLKPTLLFTPSVNQRRNFSANSLLIPEVWGSRCGVACGPLHEYNALMAREPFPDAKKALESERTRTDDDRALALALALDCRGSESLQKRLIQFKQFPPHPPLLVLFQFLSVLPSSPSGPKAALALRGQDTDATNRRIPHHVTSASASVCPSCFFLVFKIVRDE